MTQIPADYYGIRVNQPGYGPRIIAWHASNLDPIPPAKISDLSNQPCLFLGSGPPSATTLLAGNGAYIVGDTYRDLTASAEYNCTQVGTNASSEWTLIGSNPFWGLIKLNGPGLQGAVTTPADLQDWLFRPGNFLTFSNYGSIGGGGDGNQQNCPSWSIWKFTGTQPAKLGFAIGDMDGLGFGLPISTDPNWTQVFGPVPDAQYLYGIVGSLNGAGGGIN